jgi:hypothetical protein
MIDYGAFLSRAAAAGMPNHSHVFVKAFVRLAAAIREELAELNPAASAAQQAR